MEFFVLSNGATYCNEALSDQHTAILPVTALFLTCDQAMLT